MIDSPTDASTVPPSFDVRGTARAGARVRADLYLRDGDIIGDAVDVGAADANASGDFSVNVALPTVPETPSAVRVLVTQTHEGEESSATTLDLTVTRFGVSGTFTQASGALAGPVLVRLYESFAADSDSFIIDPSPGSTRSP